MHGFCSYRRLKHTPTFIICSSVIKLLVGYPTEASCFHHGVSSPERTIQPVVNSDTTLSPGGNLVLHVKMCPLHLREFTKPKQRKTQWWLTRVGSAASSHTESGGLVEPECQSGWQRQSYLHTGRPASSRSTESRRRCPEDALCIQSSWKTSLQGCDLSCWRRLWPLRHTAC